MAQTVSFTMDERFMITNMAEAHLHSPGLEDWMESSTMYDVISRIKNNNPVSLTNQELMDLKTYVLVHLRKTNPREFNEFDSWSKERINQTKKNLMNKARDWKI